MPPYTRRRHTKHFCWPTTRQTRFSHSIFQIKWLIRFEFHDIQEVCYIWKRFCNDGANNILFNCSYEKVKGIERIFSFCKFIHFAPLTRELDFIVSNFITQNKHSNGKKERKVDRNLKVVGLIFSCILLNWASVCRHFTFVEINKLVHFWIYNSEKKIIIYFTEVRPYITLTLHTPFGFDVTDFRMARSRYTLEKRKLIKTHFAVQTHTHTRCLSKKLKRNFAQQLHFIEKLLNYFAIYWKTQGKTL